MALTSDAPERLEIEGMQARDVGIVAAEHALVLHQLVDVAPSLEEAFMELTRDTVAYHGSIAHVEAPAGSSESKAA